ncbi:MAG TPA: phage holin family protein [Polyangia bacterium]|nr:phage holin family protein [Polyangia bacterium]
MYILLHLAALTATVLLLARIVPSVRVKSMGSAIVVAIVFSVLNFFLGGLLHVLLIVPGILTLGLVLLFSTFIVNLILLWLTDKLLGSFEIETLGGLVTSAAILTVVNWVFHVLVRGYFAHHHMLGVAGPGPTRWI